MVSFAVTGGGARLCFVCFFAELHPLLGMLKDGLDAVRKDRFFVS